ncbi:unnamed protein product [Boreogadus saida]
MDNIDQSTDLPLKTMYLQQVLPEIRRGVKTRLPSWENRSCPMAEIIEFGENVDRDEEVRIRFLADEKKEMARERERFPQPNRDRERFPQPVRQKEPRPCHNCGKYGHWIRECKAPRKIYRSNEKKMARSAGGHCLQLSQTDPINLAVGPTEITIQLWTGEEIQEALLGMDVLLCMDASLDFKDGELMNNLVLDQQLSIRCPLSVNALLAASVSNISTMMAPTDATNEVDDHVCEDLVTLMEEGHFVKEDPLHNPDLVLFTDGSSLVENGIRGAGYAVTTEHDVLESG